MIFTRVHRFGSSIGVVGETWSTAALTLVIMMIWSESSFFVSKQEQALPIVAINKFLKIKKKNCNAIDKKNNKKK